jgi:DUF3025 family protein
MDWDPHFAQRSPMFAPFAPYGAALAGFSEWPPLGALQELMTERQVTNSSGEPLRLVPADLPAGPYEERIYACGELAVRERNWHDFFNVLAWLSYPRAKAGLNERHFHAAQRERASNALRGTRGRVRDALTTFDESGAIVTSVDAALLDEVSAFRWKTLFWQKRRRVREAMRFFVFGHALHEKALDPYVGLTAHACLFLVDRAFNGLSLEGQIERIDVLLAQRLHDAREFTTPQALAPLPLLGVPGWWPGNEAEAFYDDAHYFRAGRMSRASS